MPLFKTISVTSQVVVYLWRISESESELRDNLVLSANSKIRLGLMRSSAHRKGFLSVRQLLCLAGYTDEQLVYDAYGKPHLTDGVQISISHSFGFSGIIVSKGCRVGIDIELQRPKILRIASRFTRPNEWSDKASLQEQIQQLTKIWCAKESLYKIMSVPGLHFLNQIHIENFLKDQNSVRAWVSHLNDNFHFHVHFLEFSGYSMAYTIWEK